MAGRGDGADRCKDTHHDEFRHKLALANAGAKCGMAACSLANNSGEMMRALARKRLLHCRGRRIKNGWMQSYL